VWLVAPAPAQVSIPPTTVALPTDKSVGFGDVYGAVRFEIEKLGPDSQEYWLKTLIRTIFGIKDGGEYIIALQVLHDSKPGDDKLVGRKVVAHFVKNENGALIPDFFGLLKRTEIGGQKVQNASLIIFSGDLISRVPISAQTNTYSVQLQIYKSNSTELTSGDMVNSMIEIINSSSSVLLFSPLNDAVKDVYGKMRQFGFQLYKGFMPRSNLVVSETKMSFIVANQSDPWPRVIKYDFPFLFDRPVGQRVCPNQSQPNRCYRNTVQIKVT